MEGDWAQGYVPDGLYTEHVFPALAPACWSGSNARARKLIVVREASCAFIDNPNQNFGRSVRAISITQPRPDRSIFLVSINVTGPQPESV